MTVGKKTPRWSLRLPPRPDWLPPEWVARWGHLTRRDGFELTVGVNFLRGDDRPRFRVGLADDPAAEVYGPAMGELGEADLEAATVADAVAEVNARWPFLAVP